MREADVLRRLRVIATDPAARGLLDDAALLDGLVLTHDSIAEGIHFLPSDPAASVGWKLVAVNLSDLAAKGATPAGALLSLSLSADHEWDERFLSGVEAACESYGLPLIGGDTVALPEGAPRMFGLTAIGRASERTPGRNGGRPGELLWVVGFIGDAAAGLEQLVANPRATGPLVDIYRRPVPLLAAGQALAAHASAMMDVSDGLLLDARRMAAASGCSITIELEAVPLSDAFRSMRGDTLDSRLFAASGGDDYALLLTLPPELDPVTLSLPSGTSMHCIGKLAGGEPQIRLTRDGNPVELPETLGYEHRGRSASPLPASPVADRH